MGAQRLTHESDAVPRAVHQHVASGPQAPGDERTRRLEKLLVSVMDQEAVLKVVVGAARSRHSKICVRNDGSPCSAGHAGQTVHRV